MSTFCRLLLCAAVLTGALDDAVDAQPPVDDTQTTPEPGRREIEQLIIEIEEAADGEPLRAAELFDAAWRLAIQREDPLIDLKTESQELLAPGEHQVNAGSRAQLQLLYAAASPAFREAYQQQVAQAAEDALAQTIDSGQLTELADVILRYQFTPAGQQALESLVRLRLSRGEYLPAALQFGRLLRLQGDDSPGKQLQLALLWWNAGLPEEAVDLARELLRTHAGQQFDVGGILIRLPDGQTDLSQWLSELGQQQTTIAGTPNTNEWSQPLGNYRRTRRQSQGPAVLKSEWEVSSFESVWNSSLDELLQPAAEQLLRDAAFGLQQNNAVAPAAVPVVIGDQLVFRTLAGVRSVDRRTGELLWESSFIDAQLQAALDYVDRSVQGGSSVLDAQETVQALLRPALLNHLIRANGAGQLTCDGRVVFAVEEVTAETMQLDWDNQLPLAQRPVNYLRAYALQGGQALGFLGGSVGLSADDLAPNPLRGFFVLGAPLLLGERIYVMAENDQGIFLLQLQAGQLDQVRPPLSMRPIHSQLLSVPRHSLREHPVRMYSGVTPSYGRGLLICNTCDEKIVAVSAEDHAVRWVYRYPSNVAAPELNSNLAVLGNSYNRDVSDQVDLATRWQDALPRIVEDRVMITPRDSDRLICLELQTGRQLWTLPRAQMRRIAFTDAQHIVLTGTDSVVCLDPATGKTIWQTQLQDGYICGKAAADGRMLYVPTSDPSIVVLDLNTGRTLLQQSVSGEIPGNLLSIDGRLYSQSLTSVRCFSTSRETAPAPLDIAARQLLDGEIDAALQTLQDIVSDSSEAAKDVRYQARRLLVDTMLESLRLDFSTNRELVPDVQRLIADSAPRDEDIVQLSRTMLGMTPGDLAVLPSVWESTDDSFHQMERLQQLTSTHQLENLDEPPAEVAAHVLRMLEQAAVTRSSYAQSGSLIRRSSRGTAAVIRAAMSVRGAESARAIQDAVRPALEQRISNAASPPQAQWWVEMSLLSGFPELAAELCRNPATLRGDSTGTVLSDLVRLAAIEQTGLAQRSQIISDLLTDWWNQDRKQLVQDLVARTRAAAKTAELDLVAFSPSRSIARNLLLPALDESLVDLTAWDAKSTSTTVTDDWKGTPTVSESDARSVGPASDPRADTLKAAIPLFGGAGAFPRWAFVQQQGTDHILAYDADGRERWTFEPGPFVYGAGSRFGYQMNSLSGRYAVACGSLLAIKIQQLLFVLDCADATRERPPELLWKLDLATALPSASGTQQFVPAWQRTTQYDLQPTGLFPVGPFTPYGLPVYSGRQVILLNALTGEREWQVDGLPEDCTMTAQDDELLLISESSGSIEVRSLIDGTSTGSATLPDWWTNASENSNASIRFFEIEPGEQQRWRLAVRNGHCLLLRRNTEASVLESVNLRNGNVVWSLNLPQDTVVSNIVDGHMAMLSDGERLQIVDLVAGVKRADLEVPAAANSQYLFLRPAGGRWLVLTDVFDREHDDQNYVSATTSVQVNGHVYAVDQQTGELSWTTPVQHRFLRILNPGQSPFPAVMPLLVLLQQPYQRGPTGIPRGATVQAVVYDARTGAKLYEGTDLGLGLSYHCLKLNNDSNAIEIGFDKRSITFQYQADPPAE